MNRIFNRPAIIDEAAAVSVNRRTEKAGQHIGLETLIAIAVFFFVAVGETVANGIVKMLVAIIDPGSGTLGFAADTFETLASLIATTAGTAVAILFMVILQKRKLRTAGFVKKNAVPHYLIGMVLGIVTFGLAILICSLTGTITISMSAGFSPLALVLLFLGYMIQGNSEEVICRGYMLVSASRRYPVFVGVIFNSLIFAAMHLANPGITVLAFVNLALFGVLMSLIFLKTGNIWMVSALHTVWNFVQGDVFGVLVSGGHTGDTILNTVSDPAKALINGGDFGLEGGLAVTIVLAVFITIFALIRPCKGVDGKVKEVAAGA